MPAYARYIHTPSFLASHLGASLLGTGIGLLGFTALFVYPAARQLNAWLRTVSSFTPMAQAAWNPSWSGVLRAPVRK